MPDRKGTINPGVTPMEELKVAKLEKAIEGGSAYAANDVISNSSSAGTPWEFTLECEKGGWIEIQEVKVTDETENISAVLDIDLFNKTPSGNLNDNVAMTSPLKAEVMEDGTGNKSHQGTIRMPVTKARGANVASTSEASMGDGISSLPKKFRCAAGSNTMYAVTSAVNAFTQSAGDKIRIEFYYREV